MVPKAGLERGRPVRYGKLRFEPCRSQPDKALFQKMVPKAGLEPARLAPLPPQDSVSTNFTTSAGSDNVPKLIPGFQQIINNLRQRQTAKISWARAPSEFLLRVSRREPIPVLQALQRPTPQEQRHRLPATQAHPMQIAARPARPAFR